MLGDVNDISPDDQVSEWRVAILADTGEVAAAYNPVYEQAQADARLITAAPELLAACKAVLAVADGDPHLRRRLQGGLEQQLRDAVAKARGNEV